MQEQLLGPPECHTDDCQFPGPKRRAGSISKCLGSQSNVQSLEPPCTKSISPKKRNHTEWEGVRKSLAPDGAAPRAAEYQRLILEKATGGKEWPDQAPPRCLTHQQET